MTTCHPEGDAGSTYASMARSVCEVGTKTARCSRFSTACAMASGPGQLSAPARRTQLREDGRSALFSAACKLAVAKLHAAIVKKGKRIKIHVPVNTRGDTLPGENGSLRGRRISPHAKHYLTSDRIQRLYIRPWPALRRDAWRRDAASRAGCLRIQLPG